MNYTQGQPVIVSRPGRLPFQGTVKHIHTAPGYVAVLDDKWGEVQSYPESFVTAVAAPEWSTETLRSGIALEVLSDDLGTMGVPGTWHRIREGSKVSHPMRNRGDALRLFQRRVRLVSGT